MLVDEVRTTDPAAEAKDRAVPGHWGGDLNFGVEKLGDREARRAHHPLDVAATACVCPDMASLGSRAVLIVIGH
jgi:hypothetical protein